VKLDKVGAGLLLVGALVGLVGIVVILIGFKASDEYRGLTEHLVGVRAATGLWLITVGVVTAIGGLLVKTTKEQPGTRSVIGDLAGLLEHPGGLGLALVIVGALLLGMSFDTDGNDHAQPAPEAAVATATP